MHMYHHSVPSFTSIYFTFHIPIYTHIKRNSIYIVNKWRVQVILLSNLKKQLFTDFFTIYVWLHDWPGSWPRWSCVLLPSIYLLSRLPATRSHTPDQSQNPVTEIIKYQDNFLSSNLASFATFPEYNNGTGTCQWLS